MELRHRYQIWMKNISFSYFNRTIMELRLMICWAISSSSAFNFNRTIMELRLPITPLKSVLFIKFQSNHNGIETRFVILKVDLQNHNFNRTIMELRLLSRKLSRYPYGFSFQSNHNGIETLICEFDLQVLFALFQSNHNGIETIVLYDKNKPIPSKFQSNHNGIETQTRRYLQSS